MNDWNEPYSQNQQPPSTPNQTEQGGDRESRRWGAGYPNLVGGQRVFDVDEVAVEAVVLGDADQLIRERVRNGLVREDLAADPRAFVPLGDERTEHLRAVLVRGVGPPGRRDRDQVVAEVDEAVNQMPVVCERASATAGNRG